MTDSAIFRKTDKGIAELQQTLATLDRAARRALIMIDGARDMDELSRFMRPGEAEPAIRRLLDGGYIEQLSGEEMPINHVAMMPYASVPENFERIKLAATLEMSAKLGAFAPTVIAEIESCQTALDMRAKLRDMEEMLIAAVGKDDGRELALRIGQELTRLVPRSELGATQRLRSLLE